MFLAAFRCIHDPNDVCDAYVDAALCRISHHVVCFLFQTTIQSKMYPFIADNLCTCEPNNLTCSEFNSIVEAVINARLCKRIAANNHLYQFSALFRFHYCLLQQRILD